MPEKIQEALEQLKIRQQEFIEKLTQAIARIVESEK